MVSDAPLSDEQFYMKHADLIDGRLDFISQLNYDKMMSFSRNAIYIWKDHAYKFSRVEEV